MRNSIIIYFTTVLTLLLLSPIRVMGESTDSDRYQTYIEASYNAGFLSSVINNVDDTYQLNAQFELGYTIGIFALNSEAIPPKEFAISFGYIVNKIAVTDGNFDKYTLMGNWTEFTDDIPNDIIRNNLRGKYDGVRYVDKLEIKDIDASIDIFVSLLQNQKNNNVRSITGALLAFDLNGDLNNEQTMFNSFTTGMMTALVNYGVDNDIDDIDDIDDIYNAQYYETIKFNNTKIIGNPFDGDAAPLEYRSNDIGNDPDIKNGISRDIFRDDFTFESIGIGGVDDIYRDQFRTALISRILTPEQALVYNLTNVKGMILYGPPGTGKTLISRKISHILSDREPKIVRGPEIYGSYVGQTESNIRDIFEDAISDQYLYGKDSPVHVIVIDEIDSFCGKRTAVHGNPVHNSAINQFLTMIDGFHEINNVFLIGTTNRLDLLDDAILRPGRFELHVKVGIPDFEGRKQIFRIHTKHIRENNLTNITDEDIATFARLTTYYTGADIAASVKRGISNGLLSVVLANPDTDFNGILITADDIISGIKEVKDTSENQIIKAHKLLERADNNLKKDKISTRKLDIYINDLKKKVQKMTNNKIILTNNLNRLDTQDKQHYVTLEYMLQSNANIRIVTDRDVFGRDTRDVKALLIDNIHKCEDADNSILYIPNVENIIRLRQVDDRVMYEDYMYDFMHQLLSLTYDSHITIILGFNTTVGQKLFENLYDWTY